MKKFLLGILLPVLTLVTLIGTGFATWYFGDNLTATASGSATVEVTSYAQVGQIDVTGTGATLTLDQKTNNGPGITLSQSIKGEYKPYTGSTAGAVNAGEVKLVATVTFTSDQATYLQLGNGWTSSDQGLTYTKEITLTSVGNRSVELVSSDFSYKKEPTTIEEYNAMVTAFNKKTITVNFVATASNPNA